MTHILSAPAQKFLNKTKGKLKLSIAKNLPKNWKKKEKHFGLRNSAFFEYSHYSNLD
jgi:hypothetical protein